VPRESPPKSNGLLFCTVLDYMIAWAAIFWRLILVSVHFVTCTFNNKKYADIAVNAVRNWEFLSSGSPLRSFEEEANPRSMLRRRNSLVIADLPPSVHSIGKAQNKGPATVFVEPETSSLLDSFGF
jgi:hypothetical protein